MNHLLGFILLQLFGLKRRKNTIHILQQKLKFTSLEEIPVDYLIHIKSLQQYSLQELIVTINHINVFSIENGCLYIQDYDGDTLIRSTILDIVLDKLSLEPRGFHSKADITCFYSQFGLPIYHNNTLQFSSLVEYKKLFSKWTYNDEPIEHVFLVDSVLGNCVDFVFPKSDQDRILKFRLSETEFITHAKIKQCISQVCMVSSVLWDSNARFGYILLKSSDASKVIEITRKEPLELELLPITVEEQVFLWELFKEQLQTEKEQKILQSKVKVQQRQKTKTLARKATTKKVTKIKKPKRGGSSTEMMKLLETMQF